jgi:hypothetical protein
MEIMGVLIGGLVGLYGGLLFGIPGWWFGRKFGLLVIAASIIVDFMHIRTLDKKLSIGSNKIYTFCLKCGEIISTRSKILATPLSFISSTTIQ